MIETFHLCNVECRQYGNLVVLTATQEHHTMGEIEHEIATITVNDSDSQTMIEQEARNILDDMGFKGAQTEEVFYD